MNLTTWLDQLAIAMQHKLLKLETFEYLQELKTWHLTDGEWLDLKALAKRRCEFFPRIAELEALSQEVKRQTASRHPSSLPWAGTFEYEGRRYARRPQKQTSA